jgi:hypothetical protein
VQKAAWCWCKAGFECSFMIKHYFLSIYTE